MSIFATLESTALARHPTRPPGWASAPAQEHPVADHDGVLMRVLDELDYGVVLLSGSQRLQFINREALRHCGAQGCLRLAQGQMEAVDERERRTLLNACSAAIGGRRSMVVLRASGRSVTVASLPVTGLDGEAAALLVLERRRVCEALSIEFFAREYRITLAETAVLQGLCDGLAAQEIAQRCGVALSTVRSQISSLRMKTGARTIGGLVRMVTVLPPVVAVLN